jgi:hypothetical protein
LIELIDSGQFAMSVTTAKASGARAALFLDTVICTDLSSTHSKAHCPVGRRIAVLFRRFVDRSARPPTALTVVKAPARLEAPALLKVPAPLKAPVLPMLTPINAANAKRS